MSSLWDTFCEKLVSSGYTLKDLAYCSEDLFLTITEEIGIFTTLQISNLVKEWRERMGPTASGRPRGLEGNDTISLSNGLLGRDTKPVVETGGLPTMVERPISSVARDVQSLLERLGGDAFEICPSNGIVAIESSVAAARCFLDRIKEVHTTAGAVEQLWKLCSARTLVKLERAALSGAPFMLSPDDDTDALCSSCIVVYHSSAPTISGYTGTALADLAHAGWALVAFDVAIGRPRTVNEQESANLGNLSIEECAKMLRSSGYDSLAVPSRKAVVICDAQQLIPRHVVYFTQRRHVGNSTPGMQMFPSAAHASHRTTMDDITPNRPNANPTGDGRFLASPQPIPASSGSGGRVITNSASTSYLSCTLHPQKDVEFWCPSEKRLLCSHCLYYDGYSKQSCVPIEKGAEDEAPRLTKWVHNAVAFTKEVEGVLGLFHAAKEDVARSAEFAREDIKKCFGRLRSRIDAVELELLSRCNVEQEQQQQQLQSSLVQVSTIVKDVNGVVRDAHNPLAQSRAGAMDFSTCVALLRNAQRAFGNWAAVVVPTYSAIRPVNVAFVDQLETALREVPPVGSVTGQVELPEAIDVNYLKEVDRNT